MKLGEALNQRKYYMNRVPQLLKALQACVTVQQGVAPNKAEPQAAELKATLDTEMAALSKIIVDINITNNSAKVGSGLTIMQAIARREYLKQAQGVYTGIAQFIRPRTEKDYRDSERTTYVAAEGIHPANIKQMMNTYASEWRALDNELQQVNWTVDLIES